MSYSNVATITYQDPDRVFIERSLNTADNWGLIVAVECPNIEIPADYEDEDVINGTTYFYQARRYSGGGFSDYSNVVEVAYVSDDPPVILIDAYSTDIISSVTGKHLCEVDFLSDQDLVEWVSRAGGEEHGQGLLVGSGNSVTADTIVEFYIEADELTQGDLTYRINVYGKNAEGMWTPYDE